MFSIRSFPKAILHIDGDAFFASCEQSRNPKLKGLPVITGKERGIASSMSYEAKTLGIVRGMNLYQIKKICPHAVILPSDYETYSLISKRFFSIVRRYTPQVEEYGIDECFADITGMRRTLRMSYPAIAKKIKEDLDTELGFTFSVGLGPTKVVAKIGSKWKKPSGLTVISGKDLHIFLEHLPAEKVWGIGPQTSAFLKKHGIETALQFAQKDEEWIVRHLTKPFYEIWHELNGRAIYEVHTEEKDSYYSVQKVKTFTPPSSDRDFIFSQLSKNIESACIKIRRHHLAAQSAAFFLRTQDFRHTGMEISFQTPLSTPSLIITALSERFDRIFDPRIRYRSTGVTLLDLREDTHVQFDLFEQTVNILTTKKLYETVDSINEKFGKHTVHLASSSIANTFSQHAGDRGDYPDRVKKLLKGESKRQHLNIPMLMGDVK